MFSEKSQKGLCKFSVKLSKLVPLQHVLGMLHIDCFSVFNKNTSYITYFLNHG